MGFGGGRTRQLSANTSVGGKAKYGKLTPGTTSGVGRFTVCDMLCRYRAVFIKAWAVASLIATAMTSFAAEPLTWVGCGITKKAFMAELSTAYTAK